MSFKKYVELKEMAVGQIKWKGQPIGHINDFNELQVNWVLEKMLDPKGGPVKGRPGEYYPPARVTMKFMADDGSGRLSPEQVIDALRLRQKGIMVAPTSVGRPIQPAGTDFTPKQELDPTRKSNAPTRIDPVASRIIERFKKSNNVLSRLADYFGSAYSNPEANKEARAKFEKQIKFNLNAIDKVFPQADVPMLISRLKNLYKFFISKEPRRDYKLRLDYHDEFERIAMLLADVLGDEFADL